VRSQGFRKNYMITMLLVIQSYNYVDSAAFVLVLPSIQTELHLSDTQLGLLTGIAFSLFHSIMGIPIARWADRGNRVTIISLAVALWSGMVALSGKATTFVQLLFTRAVVGVGEAGCVPPAQSLIPDYFTRAELPWANSVYMLAAPLSTIVGFFLAGWLSELYGWRAMFMMLGLPGVVLSLVVWLTLTEPRLERAAVVTTARTSNVTSPRRSRTAALSDAQPTLREVVLTLWRNRSFRHLLFYWSIGCFFGYGLGAFQSVFLVRSYGIKTGELGVWYAVIFGLGGLLGTYLGGALASRYAPNNERLQLRVAAILFSVFAVASALIYLTTNRHVAFALMGVGAVIGALFGAPLFTMLQTLVPPRMRAVSMAGILLISNLIGNGLGPLFAGSLSDALRPRFGDQSLRYALLALCPGYLWAAWHLWRASRTITRDLEMAQRDQGDMIVVSTPDKGRINTSVA